MMEVESQCLHQTVKLSFQNMSVINIFYLHSKIYLMTREVKKKFIWVHEQKIENIKMKQLYLSFTVMETQW